MNRAAPARVSALGRAWRWAVWVCLGGGALAGCAAPVVATAGLNFAQVGTAAFIRGELRSAEIGPMEVVYAAALEALRELELEVVSENVREHRAGITAREMRGRAISIRFQRATPVVTKVDIRVGFMGDHAMSHLVLANIQANLYPGRGQGVVPLWPRGLVP